MATTYDVRDVAGALYDSLIATASEQLRAAATRMGSASGAAAEEVALTVPPDTLPMVRNFLRVLAREGMLDQLPAIGEAFENYARAHKDQALQSEVTSAVELDEAQRQKIAEDLKQRYGNIDLRFSVDPSLIGGLLIRIGDQVLDNSLRTRLSAIERNMRVS